MLLRPQHKTTEWVYSGFMCMSTVSVHYKLKYTVTVYILPVHAVHVYVHECVSVSAHAVSTECVQVVQSFLSKDINQICNMAWFQSRYDLTLFLNFLAFCSYYYNCCRLWLSIVCSGKYYKMWSDSELKAFLLNPESFVLPFAPRALPPSHELPRRKSHSDVKALFPKQLEIQGYCPVTYVDGNKRLVVFFFFFILQLIITNFRYQYLHPGKPNIVAEYKGKLYCFKSLECQERFMRYI